MGFGYETLKKLNKRLVYASISGFGAHGPDHGKPGYDMVAAAVGGLMSITGPSVCLHVLMGLIADIIIILRDICKAHPLCLNSK